eukprot:scaffold21060_cov112-Isochrysis_galbana.AAC.2
MRRRCLRSHDLGVCPLCRKVVEYGVSCASCGGWFHATEPCCGDGLADAFLRSGRESWCCLNCAPRNDPASSKVDAPLPAALLADLASWRRAFRLLVDACGGCGRQIQDARRHLRCKQCELAFHALTPCTGLKPVAIDAACDDADWRCPTCMINDTGCTTAGAEISSDIAGGKETCPIPIINEVDDEPLNVHLPGRSAITEFEYLPQVAWRHQRAVQQRERIPLADWGGRCIAHEACSWLPATQTSGGKPVWRDDDKSGGPAYNAQRFLLYARDCIFECNATSGCDSTCYNRVVGRGIHLPLQVRKGVTRPSQTDPGPSRPRPAICVCSPAGARHPPQIPSASSGGSIAAVQGFRWPFCLCPDARAAALCPDALARAQHSLDRHGAGSCTALALLPPLNSGREQ